MKSKNSCAPYAFRAVQPDTYRLRTVQNDHTAIKNKNILQSMRHGAPPHAGIAPGVDRMVMLLAGEDSIREIIPFPMNKSAQDVMMGAPSTVEQKQLDELHIAVTCEPEA